MCDDENVEPIDETDVYRYFGDYPSGAGYVLFYQAVDLDLDALGLKRKPKPASPTPPQQGPENLMDIVEDHEAPAPPVSQKSSPVTQKSPLRVDIPTFGEPVPAQVASPVSSISATAPVPATPVREVVPTPVVSVPRPSNGNGVAPSAVQRQPSYTASRPPPPSTTLTKEKEGKWYQRKKSTDKDRRLSSGPSTVLTSPSMTRMNPGETVSTPVKAPLQRTGTSQTFNTVFSAQTGSTNFGGLGVSVPSTMHGDDAEVVMVKPVPAPNQTIPIPTQTPGRQGIDVSPKALSGSVISSTSATSASPVSSASGLGRKPSQVESTTRTRTISTSSMSSSGEKEKPGSLSRRLSGMKRSGSMFKIMGRKDKEIVEEEGAKNGLPQ